MKSKILLREKITNIISVPPDHEGGTGYLKLTDEEIDKIVKVFEQREKKIIKELSEELPVRMNYYLKQELKRLSGSENNVNVDFLPVEREKLSKN